MIISPPIHSSELALRYTGKLLLRNEIALSDAFFDLLVEQDIFQTKQPLIKSKNNKYACQRCGNIKQSLIGKIPAQHTKNPRYYCRKCIEMGRVIEDEPLYTWNGERVKWKKHITPCSWKGNLSNAQRTAADRIIQAIKHKEKELLVWAVCGSGKTEMLFPGITEALRTGKRICIATPRADVVRELLPRIKEAFPSVDIQGLYSGSTESETPAQVIIATTHQLLRFKEAFDLMIIDEVDAFPYHMDETLPFVVNRGCAKQSVTIYLTATPRVTQKQRILRNKLPHVFVPIRFHGNPLPVPRFKLCLQLARNIKSQTPHPSLLNWLKNRENQSRQIILFVPTIKLTEAFATYFIQHTKIKNVVYAHAEDSTRAEKIDQFRNKKINMIITTTILERGVTFPSIDVAVIDAGHHVFDEAALVQIAGRAGRSKEDPNGEVIYFHDGKSSAMIEARRSIIMMNNKAGFKHKRGRLI